MANVLEIVIKGRDQSGTSTLRSLRSEMDRTRTSSGGLKSAFGGLAGVLGGALKVGLAGGVAGVIALTGVMGQGVGKAMDLQQTVANTAAVMGKSVDDIRPLKTLIQDLAVDPLLKVSADEAGQAINMLARNGLTMDQILQGAAKSTVLLANATDADFGTAADIATDTMALFNIEAGDMMSAVNGVTSVVNNSKFGIDDYALALAQGGGVAATVGVKFEDFNTSIAAISPLFASGSDAGTSFKVMLQRLVPASGPAADKMKELGIITEDGSNRFFNAAGNMRGMNEIAGILQSALSGLSDEQKNQALSTIFGTDAMRAAAGMAETGKHGFEALQATMGNTSATDAAATRMNTLAGQMDILRGIVEALLLKIGDAFIPVLQRLATQASSFLDQHGNRLVQVFELMAVKVGELVVAIPPLVVQAIDMYNRISAFIQPITSAVAGFVSWKDVMIAVGAVLTITAIPAIVSFVAAAAPIVALFAGIVAATAALRRAWDNDFLGMRTAINGFMADTDKLGTLSNMFAGWGQSIKNGFNDARNTITLEGRTLTSGLKTTFTPEQLEQHAQLAITGLTLGMNVAFGALFPHAKAQGDRLVSEMAKGFSKDGLNGVATAAMGFFANGYNFKMDGLIIHVATTAKTLVDKFRSAFSVDALKNIAHRAMDGLLSGLQDKWQQALDTVGSIGQGMTNRLKSVLGIQSPSRVFMGLGNEVINGLTAGLQSNTPVVAVQGIADGLTQPLTGPGAAGGDVTNDNSNSVTNIFQVTIDAAGSSVDQLGQAVDELAFRYNANVVGA